MKFILVVARPNLFPGLSAQGLLATDSVDMAAVERHSFFAERGFMEDCSHFKQLIPYLTLELDGNNLCYQRQIKHSEQRLGGLWTIGFGGLVEPLDRDAPETRELGVLQTAALRELHEESGLTVDASALNLRGYINDESTDVSSVHFGLFYTVDLASTGLSLEQIEERVNAQAEPHRVAWRRRDELIAANGSPLAAPHEGEWEDWTRLAFTGV